MRTLLLLKLLLISTFISACGQPQTSKNAKYPMDTVSVPKDLSECFVQLNKLLSDSLKVKAKALNEKEFTARMHLSLGTWMRNNWGLWQGSRLSRYFNKKGIYHPEDMSGVILTSYYRHLNGRDIDFNEQVIYYQNYWKIVKEPTKETFPKGIRKLDFNSGLYYDSKKNGQGYIHVGTVSKTGEIWIYDH